MDIISKNLLMGLTKNKQLKKAGHLLGNSNTQDQQQASNVDKKTTPTSWLTSGGGKKITLPQNRNN